MKRARALLAMVLLASTGLSSANASDSPKPLEWAAPAYGKLPLSFEPNQGQADASVKFLSRGSGYGLFLTSTESVLVLHRPDAARARNTVRLAAVDGKSAPAVRNARPAVLRLRLMGANPRAEVVAEEELPGKSNYFVGNDERGWRTNVPQYARVTYRDVYPGVSLTYYGNQRQLEYDFVVAPGADPRAIRIRVEGAKTMTLDVEGSLVLKTDDGEVIQKVPTVYQEVAGVRRRLAGRYVLRGKREVSFAMATYDPTLPLVIDPVLVYSTYLGGGNGISNDIGTGIAVDASGNAYVTGSTSAADFPTANPLQTLQGSIDVFVAKLNPSGTALVYSTYLGGIDVEHCYALAVDTSGNAYVTGLTNSANYPTANPFQSASGGGPDAFVTKLNSSGSALVYSTYLGGNNRDYGAAIAVDSTGNAYVTGFALSTNFPMVNPLQPTRRGDLDGFVAKLNASGTALVYSTYLGGGDSYSGDDYGTGIAVDASGNAYVTGYTRSSNFPTANPLQGTLGGQYDAFVAKLNAAGSALVYSTYLGGDRDDGGTGIAVDASGNVYVTGVTSSTNFPTASPLQGVLQGANDVAYDAFVAKLNAAGSALVYSTYLGGSSQDRGTGIAVDASGNAYVTGHTSSSNFPTASPLQGAFGGPYVDAFVTELNAAGSALVYSTYLGGAHDDGGAAIAVDALGNAYVTGYTYSTNFPTANALQAGFAGPSGDVVVMKIGQGQSNGPDRTTLRFGVVNNGGTLSSLTPPQIVGISFDGDVTWTATSDQPFVTVTPTSGGGTGTISVAVVNSSLLPASGQVQSRITIVASGGSSSSRSIDVFVHVYAPGATHSPFGFFDTPANGLTGLQGAIGVTGWALDDVGVSKVELWRSRVNGDPPPAPNGLIYIGDATIVSGARPDVEGLYGNYPQAHHAAWGYMLLTNLLPNANTGAPAGGVGTFTLYAYLYDVEGKLTILSTRTFTCDNATGATKPFGTIDTPTQGQTVSGTIDNFGWVLTPQPGIIATDGSTITLFIDGIPRGTALYNFPRSDLAGYFPGYANTNGPVGFFSIDTTTLSNGVHTIAWSVTDNLGRGEGIGSRYFIVLN